MPELSAMLLGVNPPQSPRLKIAPSVPVKAWGEPRQDEKSSSAMRKILLTSSDTQILTLSEQANEIYLYTGIPCMDPIINCKIKNLMVGIFVG